MEENKKILIVDDEKLIVKAFQDHLTRKGYEIEAAFDGEEGLIKVKEFRPDLILLDILMPKMDGITLLKKLKESPETKEIPVIMITNLEKKESVAETAELGSLVYLVKSNHGLIDINREIEKSFKK